MESRERVTRAIEFERPDRVPVSYAGLYPAAFERYGESLTAVLAKYPSDFSSSGFSAIGYYRLEITDKGAHMRKYVDEWGCVWAKLHEGLEGQCIEHPLGNWEHFSKYELPEPPRFRKVPNQEYDS